MTTLDIVCMLCQRNNITIAQLERETGLSHGSIAKMRTSTPKADRLQEIADYFGVSVEYLLTGKDSEKISNSGKSYYFDDETAEMAQELFENRDMRLLFSTARNCDPHTLRKMQEILGILKRGNDNDDDNGNGRTFEH